jgi:predicted nucleic acid-binding protein
MPIGGKPFVDTNVIVYAFGANDPRREAAQALLAQGAVTGVQVLNEFVAMARRKLRMDWNEVSAALSALRVLCPSPVPLTARTHEAALQIAQRYGFSIFDSLIVAAALEARCGMLYSEDMQDGQVVDALTIRNPFVR